MTLPTWDLFITLFFLVALAYGFILGRGRIAVILVITYVAYVIANEVGEAAYKLFTGPTNLVNNLSIQGSGSLFAVKATFFALIIVLVSLKGEGALGGLGRGLRSTFLTGVYSFLNAGLIVSCVIKFLPLDSQASLFALSPLAAKVDSYRAWWLFVPAAIMIVEGLLRGKEEAKQ